ncbi:MAG: insulinase family protein, partial [Lachnospiraceae bacterium]
AVLSSAAAMSSYFPYLGILKVVLGYVDTKSYSYSELFNKINIETGGITPAINVYTNAKNLDESTVTFEWKAKTLKGKQKEAFALLKEILFTSKPEDEKRLYEIIAELKSRMQSNMISTGHQLAAGRAVSYFSKSAATLDVINGLPCYRIVEKAEADFEQYKEPLIHALQELCRYLFTKEHLMFDFTGEEEEYREFEKLSEEFLNSVYPEKESEHPFVAKPVKKNEGFLTASQVQYVCRAGNFRNAGLPYTGALRVLKVIMGYDYLWNNVRVKGGAYGCMCSFSKSGDSYFVSYRDPNLKKTIETYERAAQYVETFNQDERSMTQYIIGAISELDTPMTPATKALRSLSAYMTNQTEEDFQKERDELLSTNQATIRLLAEYLRTFISQDYLCVVGNEEKIKQEKELFQTVENLF